MPLQKFTAIIVLLLSMSQMAQAQYRPLNQSEALAEMQRFGSGKRVLYMAAHPDDENTRLIAWLSNALDAETTYLSLTRGSGGQNLIGDELGPDLGIIREHELLAARGVDGGNQRFTDAHDFGYSKSVAEVWTKWNHEDLQLQAVRTIRELKPDFIITRFPPDERAGHGHHTASAELAMECAELAADPNYDAQTAPWEVQGVWWNTSIWWDASLKDDPEAVYLDLSGFDPLLGDTYGAIGDAARSMHKCQGFGVAIDRGPREEYFKKLWGGGDLAGYLKHEKGSDANSLLAQDAVFALSIGDRDQAIRKWASLGRNLLDEIEPSSDRYTRWQQVMLHLVGIYAEYYTQENPIVWGDTVEATVALQPLDTSVHLSIAAVVTETKNMGMNPAAPLNGEGIVLKAQTTAPHSAHVRLEYDSIPFVVHLPAAAKLVDRAVGEYREKIAFVPGYRAKFDKTVTWYYRKNTTLGYSIYSPVVGKKQWAVVFTEGINQVEKVPVSGVLQKGWNHFELALPKDLPRRNLSASILLDGEHWLQEVIKISYPHIGTHYRSALAQTKVSVLELDKKRIKIGYIEGAGDVMDETLEAVGYELVRITEDTPELWGEVDAVLVGIRAFNTEAWLMDSGDRLAQFVRNGGNLVVTYTTASRAGMPLPLPVSLTVGRDRVTEEDAAVTQKNVRVLQEPNTLEAADFEGWVQERGLYFPSEYEGYNPVISITESTGTVYENSTVIAEYGKGSVIYTGLSIFRELPAGVPGALRLLQNLLHYDL
ncbi:MAG: hypothetical protein RL754_325 [Bacteroidota bacterium]